MKKLFLILLLFSCTHRGYTQTFDEWFRQKKTQIQYLLDQIAANKVYIEFAQKGYQITHEGLNLINDIKKGEFNLHNHYFNSLKNINPVITGYWKVADMISLELKITALCKSTLEQMRKSGQFRVGEITYVSDVFDKLLKEVLAAADELENIITVGPYEMTDDQRLKRIHDLYNEVQSAGRFAREFSDEARALAIQRYRELQNL